MIIRDKVAVVTGASKGIGRQTALDLAAAGADVAVSARSSEILETLAHEIKNNGMPQRAMISEVDIRPSNPS